MADRRRPWMLLAAVLAVLTLVAAACGGDDEEGDASATTEAPTDDTGDGEDDGDAPLEATAPGVTADTITIGYSYLDFDLLVEMDLSPSGWGDQEAQFQALVDDINANGGINGRQLEVVYEAYSPLGTEDAEAACLRLTEDNEVFAVVGGFLGPAEPANTCIAGRQGTILVGGVQSPDRLSEATAPWITDRPPRTRGAEIFLSLMEEEGRLDGTSVALVTNIDAQDVRDDVLASLEDHGVEPVENLVLDAPIGDIAAEDTAWAAVAERIRGSGADTVFIVGNPSSTVRGIAANGLDVELWALDQDALQNLGAATNIQDAAGTISSAPLSGQELWDHETMEDCRRVVSEAMPEVEIIDPDDLEEGDEDVAQGIVAGCRFLRLFQEIATAAGPDLTQESFADAAAGLTDFSIPGQPFASLGPDKFDSNDSFRLVEFNPDVGQDGGLDPLTDIQDVTP